MQLVATNNYLTVYKKKILFLLFFRARAVNCEGPIVPEGVIRARAVNCEGPIVPEGVIIIVYETSSKPRQFWQGRQSWGEMAQFGVCKHCWHLQHCYYAKRMGSFCRTLTKLGTRVIFALFQTSHLIELLLHISCYRLQTWPCYSQAMGD